MSGAQCNGCRFWKLDDGTKDELDADWGFGHCRRHPPLVVDSLVAAQIIPPRYGQHTDLEAPCSASLYDASLWPSTFATEWCGEYEPTPD